MLKEIIKRVRNLTEDQQTEILEILKTWQTRKQRDYQRLNTSVEISVLIGDKVIQTQTKDISASGVFINTHERYEPNQNVRVVFTAPGVAKPFKLEGVITRVEEKGIGIEFKSISPYFKEILDDVIWEDNDPE